MTITEAKRFYREDEKNYNLKENLEFLVWLEDVIRKGYKPFMNLDDMQKTIAFISEWYEIKYPEREMEFYEGIKDLDFLGINKISNAMNMNQLFYHLDAKSLFLMKADYRSNRGWQKPIYKNGSFIGWKKYSSVEINKKDKKNLNKFDHYAVEFDSHTGIIDMYFDLEDYVDYKIRSLEELLNILKLNYKEELDFSELEKLVYFHSCDLELRNKLLQCIALKLLYSKNTTPERGYERAKRFLNEFNKKLDLNLSLNEINELISKNYGSNKRLIKNMFKRNKK